MSEQPQIIRPAALAGQFYPAQPDLLAQEVDAMLAQARRETADGLPAPKVLIAPHAGHVYSGQVAARAYVRLDQARDRIRRVVLLGPCHRVAVRGIATSTATAWATPLGMVPIDQAAQQSLNGLPMVGAMDKAHAQEHCLEVHVPFLQRLLGDFSLVPLVVGEVPRDVVAAVISQLWGGPETVVIISTDLSHFLDYESCRTMDRETAAAIARLDPSCIGSSQACGRVPLGGMLELARQRGMTIETLDVRNSGDTAGPRDRVVGYGSWILHETAEGALRAVGPTLCQVARASIQSGLKNGQPARINFNGTPPAALTEFGAAFVTLKKNGQLRGCIGSVLAWRPLVEDVLDNAFKAAFKDGRFTPLTAEELPQISLSVSVLTAPSPMTITSQDDLLAQLVPHMDGLIIEDQGKRALFLPSVWDSLPDPGQFLAHLKVKAGLGAQHWSPSFQASRFHAIEIKEA